MTRKNYIIEYTATAIDGTVLKSGKIRVKNKLSELEAQVKFEAFLKKKYCNFGRLIVHKCYVDNLINSIFGDVFK